MEWKIHRVCHCGNAMNPHNNKANCSLNLICDEILTSEMEEMEKVRISEPGFSCFNKMLREMRSLLQINNSVCFGMEPTDG